MSKVVNSEWQSLPLKQIFKLKQGTYLEPSDIQSGSFFVYGANGIIGRTNKIMYEESTVLVSCRGANCGVVHFTKPKSWVSNNSIALVPIGSANLIPKFFFYQLTNSNFSDEITGSAQPQIVVGVLENKLVTIPPLSEQKRIAEILISVDRVIELTLMEIDKLKDLKKGMMQELLTKGIGHTKFKDSPVGKIPESWECKSLENVCAKITDGTHDTPKVLTEGIPFITGKHIRDSAIDFDNCDYVSQDEHDIIYRRCNPEKGDVIYVNIGAGTATPAYIEIEKQFSMKNIALLKPNKKLLDGRFLELSLLNFKTKIFAQNINGGAQPFLGLKTIGEILIAIPNLNEQFEISRAVHSIELNIKALKNNLISLNAIKKGLMNDLLTGKVRVK